MLVVIPSGIANERGALGSVQGVHVGGYNGPLGVLEVGTGCVVSLVPGLPLSEVEPLTISHVGQTLPHHSR